jgi:hypothetical protein
VSANPKKNLKHIFRNLAAGGVLAAFFLGIPSCKEPVITDSTLLNDNELLYLGKVDTFTVNSFLLREKNVKTSGVTSGILGNTSDPFFGSTTAGFFANFRTTTNNINFGSSLELDSCVLVLRYRAKYGSFSQPLSVAVYELDQDILSGTDYFSHASFAIKTPPVAQISQFTPNTTDSVRVYGRAFAPQMRIKLSNDFGNKLLLADSFNLANSAAFLSFMKGLRVAVQPGSAGNGFVALDLESTESGIALYYRNSANDSLVYLFPITASGQRVNRFEHTFGNIIHQYLNNSEDESDEQLPILSGGGTRAKLTVPQLDSLPKNIAVNKAELIIPVSSVYGSFDTIFPPPSKISFFRIDQSGKEVNDANISGGNLETVLVDSKPFKRYRIDITRFTQNLLKGNFKNNGFIIAAPDANGQRVMISNSTDKNSKIVFKIIYTKL